MNHLSVSFLEKSINDPSRAMCISHHQSVQEVLNLLVELNESHAEKIVRMLAERVDEIERFYSTTSRVLACRSDELEKLRSLYSLHEKVITAYGAFYKTPPSNVMINLRRDTEKGWIVRVGINNLTSFGPTPEDALADMLEQIGQLAKEESEALTSRISQLDVVLQVTASKNP